MARRVAVGWLAAVVLGAVGSIAAASGASGPSVTVVARNLDNPRQLWAMPGGSIYVAEAGDAGTTAVGNGEFLGFSGSIARWRPGGAVERVVENLPSIGGREGVFASGADGVAVDSNGVVYVAVAGAPCGFKGSPRAKAQLGQLLRIERGRRESVADIQRLECTQNYDRTDRNPNPYAVLALGGGHELVVDAGGNTVYDVRGRSARLLAVIPKLANGAQAVPTAIARGPDGAYYVGAFGGESRRRAKNVASVFRITPGNKPRVYATGFNAITGLAFARDGTLYVTEWSTDPTDDDHNEGDVVAVKGGKRTRLGVGKLHWPSGAAVGRDGSIYVSNWSVLPETTATNGPFEGRGGELVRIRP